MNKTVSIVTATDSSHFRSATQFLDSISTSFPAGSYEVSVWDLGLSKEERQSLSEAGAVLVEFNFAIYPSHFDMKKQAGSYAWKPIIIREMANLQRSSNDGSRFLWWMDSGNVVAPRSRQINFLSSLLGAFTKLSLGTIDEFTSNATLLRLNVNKKIRRKRSKSAAFIAFDLSKKQTWSLIDSLAESALLKDVIAPERNTSEPHRFDQSLLSIYWHTELLTNPFKTLIDFIITRIPADLIGVWIHRDID